MHPRNHAEQRPDHPCAIQAETGELLTYGALEARANQGAHFFRRLGLRTGDVVAVWLPNSLAYFELFWSAQRAGLYIVPVSTALLAAEAAYIIKDSGASLLITSGDLPNASELVGAETVRTIIAGTPLQGLPEWRELTEELPTTPIDDEQAGAHMVYSSGTTGWPKGVRHPLSGGPATAPNLFATRRQAMYGVDENSVFLTPAPLYHAAPLVHSTAAQRLGETVVLMRKFDAEGALAAIERYGVTTTQMVPTMFSRLLRLSEAVRARYDLSSLRKIIHAGSPCPIETKRRMMQWLGPILYEYYAGSEANGSTYITPQEWLERPGSVGRPNWGEVHICNSAGDPAAPGEEGLVYFSGGLNFEYHGDSLKTAGARHQRFPGWSTLGDIGYLDESGYLFLTDRKSFMIISGGVNVYPQEVENLLAEHPKIADVAVFGIPNPDMGEEVKVVIQPIDWTMAGPELAAELMAYCRQNLSPIKCPRSIDFDPALPRHETGKLYKRLLKDRYVGLTSP